jgi:hypothetical protein
MARMYGLKDNEGKIVDVSQIQPNISEEGILFNNCLYPQLDQLSVIEDVPIHVKPGKFKVTGTTFTPILEALDEYETALVTAYLSGPIGDILKQVEQIKTESADTTTALLDLYELLNTPV